MSKFVEKIKEMGSLDRLVRYHPLYYPRVLRTIKRFANSDVTVRRKLALELRAHALGRAQQTSYGRHYGGEFSAWPVLEKSTLRDRERACVRFKHFSIPASTGGTTGLPLKLLRSFECIAAEQAFIDHLLLSNGHDFRSARIAVLRADEIKHPADVEPPFGVVRHSGRRLILSNVHLCKETVAWYVDALERFNPQVLWVYPGMIANMIRLMEEAQLTLSVPIVLSSSEVMDAGLFKTIEKQLSASVIDYYGQGERVCFAYATKPNEYWFSPAYGYVELEFEKHNVPQSGPPVASIIATPYWNGAMPLVRYNTADFVVIPEDYTTRDLEEVALGMKPFLGVAGRSNEFVITSTGKIIRGLNHLPRNVSNILRLQVVQENIHQVIIKVLAQATFDKNDYETIVINAEKLFPPEIEVSIEIVDVLELAANGKTPFVIRRVA